MTGCIIMKLTALNCVVKSGYEQPPSLMRLQPVRRADGWIGRNDIIPADIFRYKSEY
ncbi:hypothetical protein L4A43_19475 [Salmonella enterica subsp. diarizonae serovar 16:z10:e,n,x,z15]|uniref:hypothetical protein n=1 Tax=Salmonella enterica TaxID=28901 RepID=UPI0018140A30|nr:hypothetical protein [Salmonella enterica subsp. diarizonae serovar 16:z10:e,n,x,z15]HAF2460462.1 hypothetical protein [Salmonella enterica]